MRKAHHDPLSALADLHELSLRNLAELDDDVIESAARQLLPENCAAARVWENNQEVF